MAAFYGSYGYLGDEIRRAQHVGPAAAAVAIMAYGAGFGAAHRSDALLDRAGPRLLGPVFAAATRIYLALPGAAGRPLLLTAICLVWGWVNHIGVTLLVVLRSADAHTAPVLELYSVVTYTAAAVGVAKAGTLYHHGGFTAVAVAAAAASAAGLLAAAIAQRHARPGPAEEPGQGRLEFPHPPGQLSGGHEPRGAEDHDHGAARPQAR